MRTSPSRRRPSPALVVSLVALVVSLGGTGYAATGGTFLLGGSNTADRSSTLTAPLGAPALTVSNASTLSGATALKLTTASTRPPLTVTSATKVANLNADKVDGLDASAFLRKLAPVTLSGSTGAGGIFSGTNTGGGNGLQGSTGSSTASGVYGENTGGGYGVAGRSNAPGGVGVLAEANDGRALVASSAGASGAIEAFNGGGPALALHVSQGAPMTVDSQEKVDNLNADRVDGTSVVSNRVISTTQFDHILEVPGFGVFYVDGCDHTNARWGWNSGGENAYVTMADLMNINDPKIAGAGNTVISPTRSRQFNLIQLARDTGGDTTLATVVLTAQGTDCVFAAQATVYGS